MKKVFLTGLSIVVLLSLIGCSMNGSPKAVRQKENVELTVSAAVSLNDALKEIKSSFEKKYAHITILFNLGGSGALQQQILQGAPTDIFISAANGPFKVLTEKGIIEKQKDLLKNKLVLIINQKQPSSIKSFQDLNMVKKIAIGTPDFVPAGMYAKQTLMHLSLWDSVKNKLIQTKDVRQVLTYVETNNVDAGIVYMTDAKISDKVKVVQTADEAYHDPIIYPAGIIKSTEHKKEADLFYNYLSSKSAQVIFKKYGFTVLD
jgi:molybdate transport system substrate-binding protein